MPDQVDQQEKNDEWGECKPSERAERLPKSRVDLWNAVDDKGLSEKKITDNLISSIKFKSDQKDDKIILITSYYFACK